MRIKCTEKFFLSCMDVQQTFSFPFSLLRHYQIHECFYVNNCFFEIMQQFCHATQFGKIAHGVGACANQPQETKYRQLFRIK